MVAQFFRPADGGIRENAGLDAIALHGGNDRFHAADLHDRDIFLRGQTEVAQRNPRTGVDGRAEAADSNRLSLKLFSLLDLRTCHEVLDESADGRGDDHHVSPAQRGAHRCATSDLQKLNLAGDQRVHPFHPARRGDDFDL